MRKAIVSLALLALMCCGEDPTRFQKKDIIPRKEFISILTEMHIMDAMSGEFRLYHYFPSGDSIQVYDRIFEKYKITPAQFDSTISMYTRRPDLFLDVYNEVLLRLNYINDTINKNDPQFSTEPSRLSPR
jgi:hypothetical protein